MGKIKKTLLLQEIESLWKELGQLSAKVDANRTSKRNALTRQDEINNELFLRMDILSKEMQILRRDLGVEANTR